MTSFCPRKGREAKVAYLQVCPWNNKFLSPQGARSKSHYKEEVDWYGGLCPRELREAKDFFSLLLSGIPSVSVPARGAKQKCNGLRRKLTLLRVSVPERGAKQKETRQETLFQYQCFCPRKGREATGCRTERSVFCIQVFVPARGAKQKVLLNSQRKP